jgi:hypothetical protein
MTEDQRKERNTERLTELYPTFRRRIKAVIEDLQGQGIRPRIQDAWRSQKDQLKPCTVIDSALNATLPAFMNCQL